MRRYNFLYIGTFSACSYFIEGDLFHKRQRQI